MSSGICNDLTLEITQMTINNKTELTVAFSHKKILYSRENETITAPGDSMDEHRTHKNTVE